MTLSRNSNGSKLAPAACTSAHQPLVQHRDYSIRDALQAAVDALGGPKAVGSMFWPELHPHTASERMSHALEHGRRERLSLDQIALIFKRAHDLGAHAGMDRLNAAFGYAPSAPIAEVDVIADLSRSAIAAVQRASDLSAELISRMRAAGLKVEGL